MQFLERKIDHNKLKKSYKKVVWFYNIWNWFTERKATSIILKFAEIKNGDTFLEIACGTGIVFRKIVDLNPQGINIGIDLSPDMLTKARKTMSESELDNYELYEGDVLNLNFKDNTFDLVINNFMIDLMPEDTFLEIAQEFYRITKPKGKAVISTLSYGTKRIHKIWYWVAKFLPNLLTGCRPVSFKSYLIKAGFIIEKEIEISQNTVPSLIIKARKP